MFSKSFSAAVEGIGASIIEAEADVSDGLPCFDVVGLCTTEVREAKERVRVALKNSGFKLPPKRITINLSPADVKKEGTSFDLAIAVSILTASGFLPESCTDDMLLLGELSLDGGVHCVRGILPIVTTAKERGFSVCVLPKENAKEGAIVGGITIYGVSHLRELYEFLLGNTALTEAATDVSMLYKEQTMEKNSLDFSEVYGQDSAKRAVEIAVAGMHHLLLIGPQGSGKTMLAERIPGIMPELSLDESLSLTKVYSVAGELSKEKPLIVKRPFRAPHHSISSAALIGGGRYPKPGEISIASGGVLFLDELTEFKKSTIELLRQPLEEHKITITRLNRAYTYPAQFMLVAAMNPCNCGYFPDKTRCSCTPSSLRRYYAKLSGPFLDRIDMVAETKAILTPFHQNTHKKQESSEEIRKRVLAARKMQKERYAKEKINFNSELSIRQIKKYCALQKEEQDFLEEVLQKLFLSVRGYHRMLKVARTIADLKLCEQITMEHLSEAVCYRSFENNYGAEVINQWN